MRTARGRRQHGMADQAAVEVTAPMVEAAMREADDAFRQQVAAFTCEENQFLDEVLGTLPPGELRALGARLDAELQYLLCCGHGDADELLDNRRAWHDALETALKRKRVRCRSPAAVERAEEQQEEQAERGMDPPDLPDGDGQPTL